MEGRRTADDRPGSQDRLTGTDACAPPADAGGRRSPYRTLLRRPAPRRFFLAATQSSAGSGLGYVALMLLAYERFRSPWAVALILMADYLPAMLAGPLIGAVVDRFSRRACAIAGDVLNAVAFAGLLAGAPLLGNALHDVAVLAALPSLGGDDRERAAATSLFNAIEEAGFVAGPLLAAALLLAVDSSALLAVNAATFAASALLLATVPFGAAAAAPHDEPASLRALAREARGGVRALAALPAARGLLASWTFAALFFSMVNVGEVLLTLDAVNLGASSFSLVVAAMSVGMTAGALTGGVAGSAGGLRRGYLLGVTGMAAGMLGAAAAGAPVLIVAAFVLLGLGNGVTVVHLNVLLQRLVPDALQGRVFALRKTLVSWTVALAYLLAGGLADLGGPRLLFAVAGAGTALVALASLRGLERSLRAPQPAAASA